VKIPIPHPALETGSHALSMTACLLTPGGRGAVATIGIRGEIHRLDPYFQAANGRAIAQQELDRICFGHWGAPLFEEIVLVRTAECEAELHCHGGQAAVDRIFADLTASGAQIHSQSDWLLHDKLPDADRLAEECLLALTRTTTQKTAHHLLRQCRLFPEAVAGLANLNPDEKARRIHEMLAWSRFGVHLTCPWKVVLCGRPNVGKSSLINALVGYPRSVVFDQPGTTRDVVAAETAFDGWPVEISDTAGFRQAAGQLETAGMALAQSRMREADLVIIVLDATEESETADQELLNAVADPLVIRNKIDLVTHLSGSEEVSHSLSVSARTGTGIPELMAAIVERVVPAEPNGHTPFPVTRRQQTWLQNLRLG